MRESGRYTGLAAFFVRLVREKPLGAASGIVVLLLILVSIFADVLAPYPMDEQNLVDRLQAPSAKYPLGTDQLGRDFLSRLIFAARLSLGVGLAATTVNVVVAFLVGGTSGFLGGKFDPGGAAVRRCVDGLPGTAHTAHRNVHNRPGFAADHPRLGISGGIAGSRVLRSRSHRREGGGLLSGRGGGWQHQVEHTHPACPAQYCRSGDRHLQHQRRRGDHGRGFLELPGFGLPAQIPSWGGMLSRDGRTHMEVAPWLALWPGLCLTVVVYVLNMFGDAMRDLLDPRLRGGEGRLDADAADAAGA